MVYVAYIRITSVFRYCWLKLGKNKGCERWSAVYGWISYMHYSIHFKKEFENSGMHWDILSDIAV